MLTVRSGPAVGLTAQVVLLAALGVTVDLSGSGWVVGLTCGVVMNAAVAGGLARSGADALGPADVVTLTRATLAGGVAALTADAFVQPPATTALLGLAVVALMLDTLDGLVARHTRTASVFGARFDGEVDAFLILVLSVFVAREVGWWVLAIGAARYAFAVAGWATPWMREQLPPRYWRKVVAATQGIVLTVAAADVLPQSLTEAALAVALALLTESFGRDVWWLWRHRRAELAGGGVRLGGRGRRRAVPAAVTNVLAVLLVWFAFLAPNEASRLTPSAFVRIPVEGLALGVLALVLPSRPRRTTAAVVGVLLGLLTVVKILDVGFFTALDRPFNVVTDRGYFVPAVALVEDSIGTVGATLAVVAVAVLVVAVLVGIPLAVRRVTGLVARHRRWSVRTVTGLMVVWIAGATSGLEIGSSGPFASADAGHLVVDRMRAIPADIQDLQRFEAAAAIDRYRDADDLLTGLRGKDVLVVVVESYGRIALEGATSAPRVQAVTEAGTSRLRASGFSSRSAYLTSPAFGAVSWLAHSTLQSGLWVDNQLLYDRLLEGDRMTLSRAFSREGWRTVAVKPSNDEEWPEGQAFYQFDKVYGRSDFDYRGPKFGWAAMPDQYALSAFQRLELARRDRTPVMAEVDLASSHSPWAPLPHLIEWNRLGDGSVFHRIRDRAQSTEELWRNPENVEAAYARSIAYCLRTVISFVEKYGDDDLVLILLGDHQPSPVVSGDEASRDVPVTVIAHDPAVIDRISGWGWQDGMRPNSQAPVWPMDAFRDRFLAAYSPVHAEQP
ncbi:MAG: CDP-alcohol phosphatidyltransferase family protein [Propionibacteriales bacterium]|nr:CDP-alcohol phosphatidyltransferase family protein [Propionibacteriales bacterium]